MLRYRYDIATIHYDIASARYDIASARYDIGADVRHAPGAWLGTEPCPRCVACRHALRTWLDAEP